MFSTACRMDRADNATRAAAAEECRQLPWRSSVCCIQSSQRYFRQSTVSSTREYSHTARSKPHQRRPGWQRRWLGDLLKGGLGGLLAGGAAGSILSGGLNDLLKQFQQSGQSETVNFWVGTGPNKTISPNDLASALGSDRMNALIAQTGMSRDDLLHGLSEYLPQWSTN